MISANYRPEYCCDFSRNRDTITTGIMTSDEITDGLVSLLKVSCKNKISISVASIASKNIKRGGHAATHAITTKFPPKRIFSRSTVSQARETGVRFLFSKILFFVRDDKHVIVQVLLDSENIRACLVSIGSRQNTNHDSTKLTLIFFRNLHDYIIIIIKMTHPLLNRQKIVSYFYIYCNYCLLLQLLLTTITLNFSTCLC